MKVEHKIIYVMCEKKNLTIAADNPSHNSKNKKNVHYLIKLFCKLNSI